MAGSRQARDVRLGALDCMVTGSGPPLVLLPGLAPENGRPVGPIRSGEIGTMNMFARQFTTYWVGRPTGLAPGTTFREIGDITAQALRETFDEPVNVLGISTGGSLAQQVAADHPELVRRLVLVSTGCRLEGHAAETQHAMIKVAGRGRPRELMAAFTWDVVPPWRGRIPAAAAMYALGLQLYPHARDLGDVTATLVAEVDFDLSSLPTISAPTLIVNGGRDRFYADSTIRETVRLIPGSRQLIDPHRGHVTVVSDRSAVRQEIAFLTEE